MRSSAAAQCPSVLQQLAAAHRSSLPLAAAARRSALMQAPASPKRETTDSTHLAAAVLMPQRSSCGGSAALTGRPQQQRCHAGCNVTTTSTGGCHLRPHRLHPAMDALRNARRQCGMGVVQRKGQLQPEPATSRTWRQHAPPNRGSCGGGSVSQDAELYFHDELQSPGQAPAAHGSGRTSDGMGLHYHDEPQSPQLACAAHGIEQEMAAAGASLGGRLQRRLRPLRGWAGREAQPPAAWAGAGRTRQRYRRLRPGINR